MRKSCGVHAFTACMLCPSVSYVIFVLCYRLRLLRDWMPSVLRWFLSSLRRWVYTKCIHVFSISESYLPSISFNHHSPSLSFGHLPSLFSCCIPSPSPSLPFLSTSSKWLQQWKELNRSPLVNSMPLLGWATLGVNIVPDVVVCRMRVSFVQHVYLICHPVQPPCMILQLRSGQCVAIITLEKHILCKKTFPFTCKTFWLYKVLIHCMTYIFLTHTYSSTSRHSVQQLGHLASLLHSYRQPFREEFHRPLKFLPPFQPPSISLPQLQAHLCPRHPTLAPALPVNMRNRRRQMIE